MTVHYWAGHINVETTLQTGDIATWAAGWLTRAENAEQRGKRLIVFEVPANEVLIAVGTIEGVLQSELGMLQQTTGTIDEIFDTGFLHDLMMPPDGG